MRQCRVRVVKVGGSLFTLPSLPATLRTWLNGQPSAVNVLIAGGGRLADVIREMDQRFCLGEDVSHWLCIDVLSVSAQLLATLLPGSRSATTLADLQAQLASGSSESPIVFCPRNFMREDEPTVGGSELPHNWNVTTDSIAARLARAIDADELVLLKSADPPAAADTDSGYVDSHFADASRNIPSVRVENLRRGRGTSPA
jgi:aspartokinase-like uncharacterized kinase